MMDFLLLTQVVMVVMVVVMDFLVLTQANHTIYDYGSFGFWVAVLAGGTTMLADGYRFENHRKFAFEELSAARDRTRSLPRSGKSRRKVGRGSMLLMLMLINIINIVKVKGC